MAFRPARVHTQWETECAMQPPDPVPTDRLKSPQEAAPSAPRGTIAPIIFRGLLAAGMTLWVAFVLCELAPVVGDIWRGLKTWEFFRRNGNGWGVASNK